MIGWIILTYGYFEATIANKIIVYSIAVLKDLTVIIWLNIAVSFVIHLYLPCLEPFDIRKIILNFNLL